MNAPAPIIKTCPMCGRTYTAEQWAALPFGYEDRDDFERLEFRHCPCTSTIAIVLETYRCEHCGGALTDFGAHGAVCLACAEANGELSDDETECAA